MAYIDPFLRSPRRHRIWVPGIVVLSFGLFGATQARSQDVAEAARQARAKKDADQKKSKHVYTNDDLKHSVILTPEDRDEIEAKKNQNSSPVDKPGDASADAIDAQATPSQTPLGDVARENRKQKFLRELQQPEQSAQFHLPVANVPLASPKPPVFPTAKAPSNSLIITWPPQRPSADIQQYVHPRRRSPFERSIVLASPAIRPALKAPSAPITNSNLQPVAPSVATVVPTPAPRVQPTSPVVSVAPKVPAPASRIVVVQSGDSLWKLAEQNLGRGNRWHDLVSANPSISDPNRLAVGSRIVVPNNSQVVSHARESHATVTVQKGDTLWTLAQTHFGHASSWTCIAQANPLLHDPNRIIAGQELVLPASCSASLSASQK